MRRIGACLPLRALLAALVAAPAAAACGSERPDAPPVSIRDSAGVEIVESRRPRGDSIAWRPASEPRLSVGAVGGDTAEVLSRVVGAVRLPDGRLVVADGGSNRLRFYGADGRFLRSAGGEGGGPGEFQHLRTLRRCHPDSLYAFDLHWGLELFDTAGRHVRTEAMDTDGTVGSPYHLTCSADGAFLFSGWGREVAERRTGFYRTRSPLWLLPSGDTARRLGTWPGAERLGSERGSRPHPFGKRLVFELAPDRIYLGTGDRYEIRVLDRRGELLRILRRPDVDLSLSDGRIERYRERRLTEAPASRRPDLRERLRDENFPETLPAFDRLVLDPAGRLWVRAFRGPRSERSRWSVFDTAGAWLGDVRTPRRFRVTEIGEDYLLGVRRGSLDVPRVELYPIRRP